MLQRKIRRFRHRPKNRIYQRHSNNGQTNVRPHSFTNDQRNLFRSTQSAEKLLEKYSALAKEAISAGDKTLSENYLQHADHFMRVIEDKNKNRIQNKTGDNLEENKTGLSKDVTSSQNNNLSQDNSNKNSE
jgi:hypothetical protein